MYNPVKERTGRVTWLDTKNGSNVVVMRSTEERT